MNKRDSNSGKTVLRYLETHITDHCNLNCAACGHYSPLAPPWFADVASMERDMRQLASLFSNIEVMHLLGGEPLLHPEVANFIDVVHRAFPAAEVNVVTNGLLLEKMPTPFWYALRRANGGVFISVYPPLAARLVSMTELVRRHGLRLLVGEMTHFNAHMNFKGDSNARIAFEACRKARYCPFLSNGRLYVCCMPSLVKHFNQHFGVQVPVGGGIDIYKAGLTGARAIAMLNAPSPTCRFCSYDFPEFPWKSSKRQMSEWDADLVRSRRSLPVLPAYGNTRSM